jgi:TatA/E family protein of Tat protein translocase
MILEDLFRNPLHLLTLLVIVVVLMGGTRLKDTMGGLGTGIKEFKKAIKDDTEAVPASSSLAVASPNGSAVAGAVFSNSSYPPAAQIVQAIRCASCGSMNPLGSKHCNECGAAVV